MAPTPVIGLLGMVDRVERRPPGAVLVTGHRIVVLGELRERSDGGELRERSDGGELRERSDGGELRERSDGGEIRDHLDLGAVSAVADEVRRLVLDGAVSGVHDIADGGFAKALAEMAARSGVGARVTYDDAFSEGAGRVIVCVVPGIDVGGIEVGVAGGDRFVIEGVVDLPLGDVVTAWRDTLPNAMHAAVAH